MIKKLIKTIRTLLVVIWCVFMFVLGGFIAFENPTNVTPQVLGMPLPEWNVGGYLTVFLTLGLLLGFLTSLFAAQTKGWRKSSELRKAKKEVALLKQSQVKV